MALYGNLVSMEVQGNALHRHADGTPNAWLTRAASARAKLKSIAAHLRLRHVAAGRHALGQPDVAADS